MMKFIVTPWRTIVNMNRKMLLASRTILIGVGLVVSVLGSGFYWLAVLAAVSPDCNELTNSALYCDSGRYITPLIIWNLAAVGFIALAVVDIRQRNKRAKGARSSK